MEVFNSQPAYHKINFVREGVKIGIVNGAIAMLLMYGSYYAGLNSFVTTQFVSKFIPYMMVTLIVYGFRLRKQNGGYLSFKEGLQYAFMSYVIAAIIVAIGTYMLFNIIDKNLTQKSFDLSLEKMKTLFHNMGIKEEDIEKQTGTKEPQKTDFKNIFLGTGFGLIWDFIVSLLVTLIIRKEKPVL